MTDQVPTNFDGRLDREYRTMQRMVEIFCAGRHGGSRGSLCPACVEFLDYAARRLEKCPYGDNKPVCAKCPIHCYKRAQREQARSIMRYAGPRMALRHPWLSLTHLLDKLRRVEHPMEMRRRERE
jgi:predicted amidophosphoribosyltransferase